MAGESRDEVQERNRRIFAAVLIACAPAAAWLLVGRHLVEARQTGVLHYSLKALLLPPVMLYLGFVILAFDVRDGQIRHMDDRGRSVLTRKGKWIVAGLVLFLIACYAGWELYLRSVGFVSTS